MEKHDTFIDAIHRMQFVNVEVNSYEKGIISRKCVPFDYGPSRKFKDGKNRYHFYDLNSPDGAHNLSILPSQLLDIEMCGESFNPENYVKWTPNWFIKRNWGKFS
jgi:hypothetical protein